MAAVLVVSLIDTVVLSGSCGFSSSHESIRGPLPGPGAGAGEILGGCGLTIVAFAIASSYRDLRQFATELHRRGEPPAALMAVRVTRDLAVW